VHAAATFTVVSATQITLTVPAGALTGPISVTTPGGIATSLAEFTVIPAPTITSFAPTSGPVGTSVTLSGTNFSGATAVELVHAAASFTVNSAAQITLTVPAGALSGPITVTTPGGTATSAAEFTVIPAPTITSFTPTSGPVGTLVTLTGTNFSGASAVAFGGTLASVFPVISPTQIVATVPAGALSGPISVTTPGGTATSGATFTVLFTPTVTLKLSGLTRGSLNLGKSVTASGKVTPTSLAGSQVKLTAQLKKSGKWTAAKTGFATISAAGAYSWKYKPAKKGSYRLQATIAATAAHTAAASTWLAFTVK
jgi:hypothetical protein